MVRSIQWLESLCMPTVSYPSSYFATSDGVTTHEHVGDLHCGFHLHHHPNTCCSYLTLCFCISHLDILCDGAVACRRILTTSPHKREPSLNNTGIVMSRRHCIEIDVTVFAGIFYDTAAVAIEFTTSDPQILPNLGSIFCRHLF